MVKNEKSNLCFDLNITSLCGISNKDGGPKGVQRQNRAKGASSVFLFWPWSSLIFPRMSSRWKKCERSKREFKIGKVEWIFTRNPDVLSRRHLNLTVKDLSKRWLWSLAKSSWSPTTTSSFTDIKSKCIYLTKVKLLSNWFTWLRNEFQPSWRWSSSRSSEWTNSYTDLKCVEQNKYVKIYVW